MGLLAHFLFGPSSFLGQQYPCIGHGYSKEPSFEHPEQRLKLTERKVFTILRFKKWYILNYAAGFIVGHSFLVVCQ